MALIHDKDPRDGKTGLVELPVGFGSSRVSETLRRAREDHNQSLGDIAEALRIRLAYLEAIESGDYGSLPGTTYAVGFVRSYADYLDLDGDEIVERFKAERHGAGAAPDLSFPEPVNAGRIPVGALALLCVVLAGLAYGGWIFLSSKGPSIANLVPPMPERVEAVIAGDDQPASETPREPVPEPPADAAPLRAYAPPEAQGAPLVSRPSTSAAPVLAPADPPPELQPGTAPEADAFQGPPPERRDRGAAVEAESGTGLAPPERAVEGPVEAQAPATLRSADADQPGVGLAAAGSDEEGTAHPAQPSAETVPGPETETGAVAEAAESRIEAAPQVSTRPAPAEDSSVAASPPAEEPDPLLPETVVIPSPPSVPQSLAVTAERSPRSYGENAPGTRIVLRALQDSWVQVRDREDSLLLTRVLRAGDKYFVPNRDGLTLLTGNAGGLEIEVDGVTIPSLGPIGAVRRQIELDPARLLDGSALPR